MLRYRSPTHFAEIFRAYYGPMVKAFGALDAEKQSRLTRELVELTERLNRSDDSTLLLPSEYLEVVVVRR